MLLVYSISERNWNRTFIKFFVSTQSFNFEILDEQLGEWVLIGLWRQTSYSELVTAVFAEFDSKSEYAILGK